MTFVYSTQNHLTRLLTRGSFTEDRQCTYNLNIVVGLRNVYTPSAIATAWYKFTQARRFHDDLTFMLLTWRIGWAPNNASKWQMGINSAFKGLTSPVTKKNSSVFLWIFRNVCLTLSQYGFPQHISLTVLRYKPEGRGFDPRWCHWNF